MLRAMTAGAQLKQKPLENFQGSCAPAGDLAGSWLALLAPLPLREVSELWRPFRYFDYSVNWADLA